MIVAITGGTGFVGKRLVAQHLANGDVVRVLSRGLHPLVDDRVEYFRHDLGTSDPVPLTFLSGADVIYHCAAEIYDTHKMLATNVEGTKRLIDAARSRVRRWVQLSSVGVYGQTADVDEDAQERPRTLYEFSKAKADALVRAAEASEAFEAVICRPTTVYGEEMENQSLYSLIRVINSGLFFFIGPPGAIAHYVHVNDVARGLWLCGVHGRAAGKTFIVADDHAFEEFVLTIANQLDRRVPTLRFPSWFCSLVALFLGRIPGFPLTLSRINALTDRTRYRGDKIVSELGFKCDIDMSKGMQRMVRCLKDGVHTKR